MENPTLFFVFFVAFVVHRTNGIRVIISEIETAAH